MTNTTERMTINSKDFDLTKIPADECVACRCKKSVQNRLEGSFFCSDCDVIYNTVPRATL